MPQTVKFGPNETIQNIILEAIDDDVVEYDEVLTLKIDITDELMEIGIMPGVLNEMTATIVETDGKSIFCILSLPYCCCFVSFSCYCIF